MRYTTPLTATAGISKWPEEKTAFKAFFLQGAPRGTPYVEKRTFWAGSKLSIALMRPMQPTWKRSSTFSPRPENFWMTESTSRRLPLMSSSRADWSPARARRRSAWVSSFFKTGSFAVFTPHISTFPCKGKAPFTEGGDIFSRKWAFDAELQRIWPGNVRRMRVFPGEKCTNGLNLAVFVISYAG